MVGEMTHLDSSAHVPVPAAFDNGRRDGPQEIEHHFGSSAIVRHEHRIVGVVDILLFAQQFAREDRSLNAEQIAQLAAYGKVE